MMAKQSLATLKTSQLLRGLTEFVNMRDSVDDVRRFLRRWPTFLDPGDEKKGEYYIEICRSMGFDPWELVRKDPDDETLAMLGDNPSILGLRDHVRGVWRGGEDSNARMTILLFGFQHWPTGHRKMILPDWQRSEIIYRATTMFQKACYLLLKNSQKAKVCANPDCPAPYFIGKRPFQRYCTPDCLKPFQKEWKRSWWDRVGKQRRKRKKKRAKK